MTPVQVRWMVFGQGVAQCTHLTGATCTACNTEYEVYKAIGITFVNTCIKRAIYRKSHMYNCAFSDRLYKSNWRWYLFVRNAENRKRQSTTTKSELPDTCMTVQATLLLVTPSDTSNT